uniref:BRCA1-associated RING domain protein 1 n=1 Tax=Lygus hesperus TaxID=30085 RepID=A0A0A9XBX7_LYGHE
MLASDHGHTRMVRYILSHNASTCSVDANKDSLMHYALHYRLSKLFEGEYVLPEGQFDVAVLLALHGAPVDLLNDQEELPTHYIQKQLPSFLTVLQQLASFS